MQTVPDLSVLWRQYFLNVPPTQDGDSWSIVFIASNAGGVLVSLANPFTEQHEEMFVRTVTERDLALFTDQYKQRFMTNLQQRFGFFRPDVRQVLTEYPNWPTFYDAWLDNNPQLLQANLPLLFDYPTADEYRAMQLKDADYAGYRRLLVVVYQYRKQQFQRIFIKQVDDEAYAYIQQQITNLYQSSLSNLITKQTGVTV